MIESHLHLKILPEIFAVSQGNDLNELPDLAELGEFWSLTRTDNEISFVSEENNVPKHWKTESGWKIIKFIGPLDFALTGILESLPILPLT